MARGVWSGVGDRESWEKAGEDGAVEPGEVGRDRFRGFDTSIGSSMWESREWERDMMGELELELEFEKAYDCREGRCVL